MSWFVGSYQEETFRLLMDYFAGRHMKILTSNSPSHIKAESGSWTSVSPGNARGDVEADIRKRDGGSYVTLSLNFLKEYLMALVAAVIGALFIYGVMWWLVIVNPLQRAIDPLEWNFHAIIVVLLYLALSLGYLGYNTLLTRRRFMEEFNMFAQSLCLARMLKKTRV